MYQFLFITRNKLMNNAECKCNETKLVCQNFNLLIQEWESRKYFVKACLLSSEIF